jgi:hypothetical protein
MITMVMYAKIGGGYFTVNICRLMRFRAKILPNKHTPTEKLQCVYPESIKDSNGH